VNRQNGSDVIGTETTPTGLTQRARHVRVLPELGSLIGHTAASRPRSTSVAPCRRRDAGGDAFLSDCEQALDSLLDDVRAAMATEPEWTHGVGRALHALLEGFTCSPRLARAWFAELPAVETGAERRGSAVRRLAVTLAPPEHHGDEPIPSPVAVLLIAGAVWNAIERAIHDGSSLPHLLPHLHYHALVYQLEPQHAARQVGLAA
jgi:hypothetical protein